MNHLIAEASEKAGLADTNTLMNQRIAELASDWISVAFQGDYNTSILDVGAGAGRTTQALVKELSGLKLSKMAREAADVHFELLEPSRKRLEAAMEVIGKAAQGTWLEEALSVGPIHGTVDELAFQDECVYDVVITNAAIHHEPFNSHLSSMYRVLRPGCPLVSGD
jgi:SAM-dependent methyltransferase